MKKFNHFDIDPYGEEIWDDAIVRRGFWDVLKYQYKYLISLSLGLILFGFIGSMVNLFQDKQEVPITIGSNGWSGFTPTISTWTPSDNKDSVLKAHYTISNSDEVADKLISKYKEEEIKTKLKEYIFSKAKLEEYVKNKISEKDGKFPEIVIHKN